MRRLLLLLFFLTFAASCAVVHAQNTVQGNVPLAGSNPQFTAVDPFANGLTPANALKPPRPFWYVVDKNGLTIMGLRTEKTGALMVGGPTINVVENEVVGYVAWPDAISITQPDGEVPIDPSVAVDPAAPDHNKFVWRSEIGGAWEPVGITVSYPTDEALASNSETPATYVYVVMKHSGREWASSITGNPAAGLDPNLRDTIRPMTSEATESSFLVQVDVSQPDYPIDLFPMGAPIGGGLLGHDAGQPAFDPATDSVYVGNMPSLSLPTSLDVPNDLTSFVSVVMLAPAELPAPGEGAPAPVTVTVLCGPEHPDIPLLAGVPEAWACIAEGGEGPFQWTFTDLPDWLIAHVDPITGQGDGILYGTPPAGVYTFQAHVDDNATTPPGTGDASITLTVTSDPTAEYEYGELEWEVGAPAAVAIEGTLKAGATGDPCLLTSTLSPGSVVPAWVDVKQIESPGRTIDNTAVGGPVETTLGCVIMGTPPISGERYEFQMPNLQFTWPSQNLPIVVSGQVAGPYTFDSLPEGVGLSGLAWHQIDKIHDPSTEADMLNHEFFGVEPYTGQMYRVVAPYAGLEAEGTIVPPPALQGESDEVEPYGEVLTTLLTARPDIAAALAANPNLKVNFGNVAVEANPNAQVFVTATQISDPTGLDPTAITTPIGGPAGSSIPAGALIKVSGTRDAQDPEALTLGPMSAIDLPGVQSFYLGLDSDLAPAVPGEPGQHDNGLLWVTGSTTGNVATVDTTLGTYSQLLPISGATSLGGVSVYPTTSVASVGPLKSVAYVASPTLNSVTLFGAGDAPNTAPVIWSGSSTTFKVGTEGWFKVTAIGSPIPVLSYTAASWPDGVSFTPNADGTATLAGIATVGADGIYPFTITATNAAGAVSQEFTLTVDPGTPPAITSASTTTFTVGLAGSFTVTATGSPKPSLTADGLPGWLTLADNGGGSGTLAGTPGIGADGNYTFTITATNLVGSPATQTFELVVNPGTPPQITSANSATFTEGSAGSFVVTATGSPLPSLSKGGATLPGGVTFIDNGNGTATLAGTPAIGSANTYNFTITAANGLPDDATQAFTLTVNAPPPAAPVITSADATTFTVGSPGSFTVTSTGWPTPMLEAWGDMPAGVSFKDNLDGTGTLAGTPAALTGGSHQISIRADNSVDLVVQNFTLTVIPSSGTAPAITSANSTTFTVGSAGSFTVTATGTPTPQIIVQTQPPAWLTIGPSVDGSLTMTGTPPPASQGNYPFTITAANGISPNASQSFSLVVNAAANNPPVATPQSVTTAENTAKSITLAGTDADGDGLSYAVVTPPQHGSLSGTTPNLTYTPAANYSGGDSFTFKVNDGKADSEPATVSITVTLVNEPPVANDQSVTTSQDTAKAITLNASDPDGDPLTYAVVQPQHGTVTGTAPALTYTPNAGYSGPDSFTFTVNDGTVSSAQATVSITVTAVVQPLTIVTTSLPNGTVGTQYSYQLAASGGTQPYVWSPLGRMPFGLRLSSTGLISGKPNAAGTTTFTVQVRDSASQSKSTSLTLTISVKPPRPRR